MEGKTQQTTVFGAGMSERSARKWQCGPLPSKTMQERWWRARPGPLDKLRRRALNGPDQEVYFPQ